MTVRLAKARVGDVTMQGLTPLQSPIPSGPILVRVDRAEYEQMVREYAHARLVVDWGEPDEQGAYTPTVRAVEDRHA